MKHDTTILIRNLAEDAHAVRPLPRAWIRTCTWLAVSVAYIGIVLLVIPRSGLPSRFFEGPFLLEQAAASILAAGAAFAAFATVIPGTGRKVFAWLLVPFALWLAVLGRPCLMEVMRPGGISLAHDQSCLPLIVLLAAFPAGLMAVMLRRGAPLTPHLTIALGALGSTALANFFLRLFHPEEVTVMLVVWHAGGVFALTALAGMLARQVLDWKSICKVGHSSAGWRGG